MGHTIQLFVARPRVLEVFRGVLPTISIQALTPGATLAVIALDAATQDALHRAYGTGEWPDGLSLGLSSRDMANAAAASRAGPLAYVETHDDDADGGQAAIVWIAGQATIGPIFMSRSEQARRPPAFWPVNAALRALGVTATAGLDEFATFGLGRWRSTDEIIAGARRVTGG